MIHIEKKLCASCDKFKDLNDFYARNDKYYSSYCRECSLKKQKTYRKSVRSKEQNRESQMKSSYNLSKREYDNIFKAQDGKCAICRIDSKDLKQSLHIDHDHKTGKVRGLLCRSCNHGLGNFRDNISFLEDAIYYLILNK